MNSKESAHRSKDRGSTTVTAAFLLHRKFIHKFLTRFFFEEQDIEDVTQETFLRAYAAEKKKTLGIEHPKAYLFRIAKNIALTRLTQKSKQITSYIEDLSDSSVINSVENASDEAEARETLGIYCEAVASLPEKCRQVFLLRKVHGLSHKEIAEHMSLSVSSVEKYLRTGILTCREYLREGEVEAKSKRLATGGISPIKRNRS